ncbi:hypothetical protein AMATHDRAFT_65776 [Amanita thiersii Skay4041]|uniref:Uncharacterized protein n=1 Tax=Amanita thiersii Skay4041 TaxID=703135 RepID=A0A2A9NJ68_9AGAR|nr:hypothetical protein AMATHDRAFT_65776 [Amanita thiersii Skay4041]
MISFNVTPFTDLPAHHMLRSYFTKDTKSKESDVNNVLLSHLWSDDRRREEQRFSSFMSELGDMAKDLGVVVPTTPEPGPATDNSVNDSPPEDNAGSNQESDSPEVARCFKPERREPSPEQLALPRTPKVVYPYKDSYKERQWPRRPKSVEEERQDAWIQKMTVKVQSLLLEVHQVLGTNPVLLSPPLDYTKDDPLPDDDFMGAVAESSANSDSPLDSSLLSTNYQHAILVPDDSNSYEEDHSAVTDIFEDDDFNLGDVSVCTADTSYSLDAEVNKSVSDNV